jgi:7-cyano-7-deazaguanine tRNA-ribosyltransferase
MCFELRNRDILARIGRLQTKSGKIETPILLPVINPAIQSISPRSLSEEFDCKALITNAYVIKKHRAEEAREKGIHKLLDFNGIIMTDSGAYQILVYGKVAVSPEEIVKFQEEIGTDIATILDIPTSWNSTEKHAKQTVEDTIGRASQLESLKTRDDILWVAPVQGGKHIELVAHSAKSVGHMPFQIHALGSPTTIMQQYIFDILVDMILTAKMNLPPQRPLHLFGAGHPFMFALAVALGCDIFDSAAYSIFARQDRYMTRYGTRRLDQLEYLPCSCPVCIKSTPNKFREMPKAEREEQLARHNLYISFAEIKLIKQSIIEGRLWEHLEQRAHSHPALLQAAKRLSKYRNFLEQHGPVTKRRGLFFFNSIGLARPEIVHYQKNLHVRYSQPQEANTLLLLPQPTKKPFHKVAVIKKLYKTIQDELPEASKLLHICFYGAPFGVVPIELDEVYPLSQFEIAQPLDYETISYVAQEVEKYISRSLYKEVIIIEDEELKGKVSEACRHSKRKDLSITFLGVEGSLNEAFFDTIVETLRNRWLDKETCSK